ncbi:unnamed protein product [[Candida] boidinii]|uniref:L-lactate dehydrogenase (cytochrome) n=1 Tax=Candida boidinii TaxID=5477 RepID=A0A9W6WHD6_CANBO|nr:oxidoreductase activity protein [[Candida] boidinii]OWB84796.1 oxidoreductase activity protein [[Candida] boidinii]GME72242.1 unnamed protein product [[Candida] boidinii]GME88055.1 unnamed protein product [[Candida] boidinii]GMF97595.1 unnamed protein product [[Candida] boidinii]
MFKQSQRSLLRSLLSSNKSSVNTTSSRINLIKKNFSTSKYTNSSVSSSVTNTKNNHSNNNNQNQKSDNIFAYSTLLSVAAVLTTFTLNQQSSISNDAKFASPNANKKISVDEFVKHDTPEDCWVVIDGNVYDMTDFIDNHPGGRGAIVSNAGKDVTEIFDPIHAPGILEQYLPEEKFLGIIDGEAPKPEFEMDEEELERLRRINNKPNINQVFNIHDFEHIAKNILPKSAWAYYSTGADDEIIMRENHYAYQRIYFKPRILRDVSEIDLSTEMLGVKTSAPFYLTATALAKLGHPDGEIGIAKAAGREDVIQMISTFSSCSLDDIAKVAVPGQTQWFQLYVNTERDVAYNLIKKAEELGMKGIFLTVDSVVAGNRETDKKMKAAKNADDEPTEIVPAPKPKIGRNLRSLIDPRLTWDDLKEFKKHSNLPIVLKGVQTVEDVVLAAENGVSGVVLSNHGGRQLEYAPPPIELLAEVMPVLRERGLDKNFDVFVDGGVRRGTDILKAICLGAKGVGIGRPVLYSLSSYGEEGVVKAIDILKGELDVNMRLLGVKNISELNESYVDTRKLLGRSANDNLFDRSYSPLNFVKFKEED